MAEPLHLAVAQGPADLPDGAARLAWLEAQLEALKGEGIDLIVLPELFACGYAIGDLVHSRAEPRDGPLAEALAELAQRYGLAIHCGYAERDGVRLFNSAMCVGPDGNLLGHHRKLAIPPGFERDYYTAGAGCTLFSFKGFRIATLICYDAEFAETARHVATMGADLVLVPTALGAAWGWVAEQMIPTRGFENGVFLAYANSAGIQGEMEFLGKSFIAAPDGQELARAAGAPCVLTAQLDHVRVAKAQARLPYLTDRKRLSLE